MTDSDATDIPLEPADLAAVDAAGLRGRAVLGFEVAGDGVAIVAETSSSQMLDDWRRARAAMAVTHRWPVLVTAFQGYAQPWRDAIIAEDPFSRFFFREGMKDGDPSPQGVLSGAERIDVDARLARVEAWRGQYWREHPDDAVEAQLDITRRLCPSAPDAASVRAAAVDAADPYVAAERFLYDWEDARGCASTPDEDDGYQSWFDPTEAGAPVGLALLPTADPWAVHAYISSLYDATSYGQDLLVAVAHRWYDEFGAEPVALWGTMVQMVVARPPADRESAWRVAREHQLLAENTLIGPGIPIRQHARYLVGREKWFLHSRP